MQGQSAQVSVGALTVDEESATVGSAGATGRGEAPDAIDTETREEVPAAAELFDPGTTLRVIGTQNLVPVLAAVASFLAFSVVL